MNNAAKVIIICRFAKCLTLFSSLYFAPFVDRSFRN